MTNEDLQINVSKLGVGVALIAGLCGMLGAFVILPYRMSAAEAEIGILKRKVEMQSDVLARIDENVKQLKAERRLQ